MYPSKSASSSLSTYLSIYPAAHFLVLNLTTSVIKVHKLFPEMDIDSGFFEIFFRYIHPV